jgi:addiction module RelE/StbE family toxin
MRVRFTRPAQADLDGIYAYISRDNPLAAPRVVTELIERAQALGETPYEGRATDEPNARVLTIPRLRYFIFYTIAGNEVQITHIRHTSRRRPPGWQR